MYWICTNCGKRIHMGGSGKPSAKSGGRCPAHPAGIHLWILDE